MTFSMTGYGKSVQQCNGRIITIEIKTLNSKQSDVNVRMPQVYRELELELRDRVTNVLQRGKIDINIQRDFSEDDAEGQINIALVKAYYNSLKSIEKELAEKPGERATDYLSLILKMPDVLKPVNESLEDAERELVRKGLEECLRNVQEFRAQEGAKLQAVLQAGNAEIETALEKVAPFETARLDRVRQRIRAGFGEDADFAVVDKDRFEQELVYYLEKLDITEEKVRLKAHCEYFMQTLLNEDFKGKKLGFIAQEMGREINTLGSKAQHSEMQRIVVSMKDELEKIKEQLLNVL